MQIPAISGKIGENTGGMIMSHRSQIRQITFTKEERKEIRRRIRKAKDRKTADRLRVVLYKADGYKHHVIAHLLQMSINVVTQCLQRYLAGGLDALCSTNYQGKQARLTMEQQEILKIELRTSIYNNADQVIAWVEKRFGVSYKLRGMHTLLKRLGFTYKKNRLVPSKADPEAQRQFVSWFKKVRAALGPEDRLYFGDAVHVKHNAEAGYAWSESGHPHLIPTNTGRQRYNILGAYCTQTHEHLFILTEDNINQDTIIELLKQLRAKHPGDGKIYLILDNASYNRALRVREQAAESKVIIKYQPPYSPNLNLIERLWKFMRRQLFKDKYRSTFAKFREQVDAFFANLDQYKDELSTLLTEEFELVPAVWQAPNVA
jgi:transposase